MNMWFMKKAKIVNHSCFEKCACSSFSEWTKKKRQSKQKKEVTNKKILGQLCVS